MQALSDTNLAEEISAGAWEQRVHGISGCMGSAGAWDQRVHGISGCMGSAGAWDQRVHVPLIQSVQSSRVAVEHWAQEPLIRVEPCQHPNQ
jgi:hypothetical protein